MAMWRYVEGKEVQKKFKKGDKCPYDNGSSCLYDCIDETDNCFAICDDYPFEAGEKGICRCTARTSTVKYVEIRKVKVKMRVIRD